MGFGFTAELAVKPNPSLKSLSCFSREGVTDYLSGLSGFTTITASHPLERAKPELVFFSPAKPELAFSTPLKPARSVVFSTRARDRIVESHPKGVRCSDLLFLQGMDSVRFSEDSQTSTVRSPNKRSSGNKRWTTTESRYFIRFMASQVEQGFKVDKGFKPQALHAATLAMKEKFGIIVSDSNVSNHLRTLKRRWARIRRLKELSGMGWDDKQKMIIMGDSEYEEYIKAHPQDEPFLNKTIEDHDFLEMICGNDQATGRRAIHFGDEIGTNMYDDSAISQSPQIDLDDMSVEETEAHANTSTPIHIQSESPEPRKTSTQTKKGKGKRKLISEVEAIQEMNSTIKEAFATINTPIEKSSFASEKLSFAKEIVNECRKLQAYGYSGREINTAYDWLMADENRAISFLAKDDELRMYWAEEFFMSLGNQGGGSGRQY